MYTYKGFSHYVSYGGSKNFCLTRFPKLMIVVLTLEYQSRYTYNIK